MSLHSLLALLRKAQNKKIHNYEKSFYFIFFKCFFLPLVHLQLHTKLYFIFFKCFFLPLVQPLWWLQCNNTHKVVCVNGVNSKPSVFQCKPSTYDALNESLGKTSPYIREKWELCFIKYAEMMFQKFMIFLGNMRMVMCEEFFGDSYRRLIGDFPILSRTFTEFSKFRESKNHFSMIGAQFKDPVSTLSYAGAVVASWSLTQEVAGSSPFYCVMTNIFCH